MALNIILLIIGILLIVFGAEFLTQGASGIARRFKIPEIIIGLTIVAFGTSAPELAVSIVSSMESNGGIAVGNVIGSNIFNILMILGLCAVIRPVPVNRNSVRFDIPIAITAAALLIVLLSDNWFGNSSTLSRSDALILFICGLLFLYYTFQMSKRSRQNQEEEEHQSEIKEKHWAINTLLIIGGLVALVYGGTLFVDHSSALATALGVSDTLIGLTLVAWGTSMPELATSVVATIRGRDGISFGNLVGSNIFNIFFVLGISGLVNPLENLEFTQLDLWMQFIAMMITYLFVLFFGKRVIKRWEGSIMLLVFVLYTGYIIYKEVALSL